MVYKLIKWVDWESKALKAKTNTLGYQYRNNSIQEVSQNLETLLWFLDFYQVY